MRCAARSAAATLGTGSCVQSATPNKASHDAYAQLPLELPSDRPYRAGIAPYPGQARCLALSFWPECFQRLNLKVAKCHFRRKREAPLTLRGSTSQFRGHPRA
jgi:hypothetical protein